MRKTLAALATLLAITAGAVVPPTATNDQQETGTASSQSFSLYSADGVARVDGTLFAGTVLPKCGGAVDKRLDAFLLVSPAFDSNAGTGVDATWYFCDQYEGDWYAMPVGTSQTEQPKTLADIRAQIETWAQAGNTDALPLSKLPACSASQILKRNSGNTAWECAADTGVASVAVTSGGGLIDSGTGGGSSLGLENCTAGQILKRNAGNTAWECSADTGASITAPTGSGITASTSGGSTEISLQDCAADELLKRNSSDTMWICGADATGGSTSGLTETQVKAEIRTFAQRDATDRTARVDLATFMSNADAASQRFTTDALGNDVVTQAKLADNSVGTDQIQNSSVAHADLAADQRLPTGCTDEQYVSWETSTTPDAWECVDLPTETGDIEGITTASTGGLVGGASSGTPSISIRSCPANEILKRNAAGDAWVCAADATGSAISGLDETQVKAEIRDFAESDQPDAAARVALADFANGATLETQRFDGDALTVDQTLPSCTDGQKIEWDTSTDPDTWICVSIANTVSTDSTIDGDGSSGSPLAVANPFSSADEATLDTAEDLFHDVDSIGSVTLTQGAGNSATISNLDLPSDGVLQVVARRTSTPAVGPFSLVYSVADILALSRANTSGQQLTGSNSIAMTVGENEFDLRIGSNGSGKIVYASDTGGNYSFAFTGVSANLESFAFTDETTSLPPAKFAGDYFSSAGDTAPTRSGGRWRFDLQAGTVGAAEIATGAVGTNEIATGAVANADLANNSVTATKIADGNVGTAELTNDSVTGPKIMDGTIRAADLDASQTLPSCSDGEIIEWDTTPNPDTWSCVSAGAGDITAVTTASGSGLTGGNTSGAIALAVRDCGANELLKRNAADNAWICAADLTGPASSGLDETQVKAEIRDFAETDQTDVAARTNFSTFINAATADAQRVGNGGLATDSVRAGQIQAGAVGASEIASSAVTSIKLADGTIATVDLANSSVTSVKIVDGTVGNADLGTDAVTGAKIADDAVGNEHIAAGAVDSAALATGAVASVDIAGNAVTTDKIASGAVQNSDIGASAVNSSKIADGQVFGQDLASNSVTSVKILDGTISADDLGANSVGASEIATNAVGASELADNAVDTGALAANSVTGAKIAAGTVASSDLALNQRLPTCTDEQIVEWDTTTTRWVCIAKPSGGGLDGGAVRDQVRMQLTQGSGITLTQTGTGASQTLQIASTGSGDSLAAEVLLDYNPSAAVQITNANQFQELPAAAAFSRALTSADDDRLMLIEGVISQSSSDANGYPWSTPIIIKAGDWRNVSTTAEDATPDNVDGWFMPIQVAGWTVDHWQRLVIGKGANGRIGLTSQRAGTTDGWIQRFRVRLLRDNGGTGGSGDIEGITTVATGGLIGGVDSGTPSLAIRNCPANEILKRNSAGNAWECATDAGGLSEAQVKSEIRDFAEADTAAATARTEFATFINAATADTQRVGTGGIADDAINADKLAGKSVTPSALDDNAVTGPKLIVGQRMPSCSDGQIVEWDTSGNPDAWICVAKPAGSGGGLTATQVDARIQNFARASTHVDDLDNLGVSDISFSDELFIHDDSADEVARVDMGDINAFVKNEIRTFAEADQTDAAARTNLASLVNAATANTQRIGSGGLATTQRLPSCTNGQYASWNNTSSLWECVNAPTGGGTGDIEGITTPAAGGLVGGATSGTPSLSLRDCAAGQVLKRNAADNAWECAADATGSGGGSTDALTLEVRASTPATTGFTVNDIIDVNGDLLVLTDDTVQGHVLRGTAGDYSGSNYVGVASGITGHTDVGTWTDSAVVAEVSWLPAASGNLPIWDVYFSRTALGSTPPSNLYMTVVGESGTDTGGNSIVRAQTDVVLSRSSVNDIANVAYAYRSDADDPSSPVIAGDTFEVRVYSNSARTTAQKVHGADRWERYADIHVTPTKHTDFRPYALAQTSDDGARESIATLMNNASERDERFSASALVAQDVRQISQRVLTTTAGSQGVDHGSTRELTRQWTQVNTMVLTPAICNSGRVGPNLWAEIGWTGQISNDRPQCGTLTEDGRILITGNPALMGVSRIEFQSGPRFFGSDFYANRVKIWHGFTGDDVALNPFVGGTLTIDGTSYPLIVGQQHELAVTAVLQGNPFRVGSTSRIKLVGPNGFPDLSPNDLFAAGERIRYERDRWRTANGKLDPYELAAALELLEDTNRLHVSAIDGGVQFFQHSGATNLNNLLETGVHVLTETATITNDPFPAPATTRVVYVSEQLTHEFEGRQVAMLESGAQTWNGYIVRVVGTHDADISYTAIGSSTTANRGRVRMAFTSTTNPFPQAVKNFIVRIGGTTYTLPVTRDSLATNYVLQSGTRTSDLVGVTDGSGFDMNIQVTFQDNTVAFSRPYRHVQQEAVSHSPTALYSYHRQSDNASTITGITSQWIAFDQGHYDGLSAVADASDWKVLAEETLANGSQQAATLDRAAIRQVVQAAESGNTFPVAPTVGQTFELLADVTLPGFGIITAGSLDNQIGYEAGSPGLGSIDQTAAGLTGLLSYTNSFSNTGLRQRTAVIRSLTNTTAWDRLVIDGVSHTLTQFGSLPRWFITGTATTPLLADGQTYVVQVTSGTGGSQVKMFPDRVYEGGHRYAWDGRQWVRANGEIDAHDIVAGLEELEGTDRLSIDAVDGGLKWWTGTQTAYDALPVKDSGTAYFIAN